MKVLIVEDEDLAVKKMQKTLKNVEPDAEIVGVTDSITGTVAWLQENEIPELILMDIELADGQSFEIFNQTEITCPVIFTTSYDEFALKAFKVNSIDYLLKPVQKEDLQKSLQKLRTLAGSRQQATGVDMDHIIKQLQQTLQPKEYRKRFLVKHGQKLVSIDASDIRYFFSDGRLNFFKTADNRKFVLDYTMDELEEMLDPATYFRISRSFYVSIGSIEKIDDYFGNRLILQLRPAVEKEALVSREKVTDFKKWMGK